MSFHDDVERVLREEERKNRRTQTSSARRATSRQFEQPTYFAVVYAKLLMRFGRGRQSSINEKNGIPSKKRVSFFSIIKGDIKRFFIKPKKMKMPKDNDSWDKWKEYFTEEDRRWKEDL